MKIKKRKRKFYSLNPVVQKFFEDHSPYVFIQHEAFFHDGATALRSAESWEAMEPPEDKSPLELARAIHHFCEVTAQHAQEAFEEYQSMLEQQQIIFDEEEKLAELLKLRDKARSARKKLKAAEKQLEAVTPKRVLQRPKLQAANRQQAEEFKRKVRKLKL